ncbi:MAG: DUF6557 family protein [Promethearchaeota archaeon]
MPETRCYILVLTRWEEWLGLEIHLDTLNNFDFIDIIVHCLWEMTFQVLLICLPHHYQ